MSTQTTPHQSFPAPCKRCGGALYQEADRCPYCGAAHPLDDPPDAPFGSAAAAAAAAATAAGPQRHPFGPKAQTDGAPSDLASPDTPIPPLGHAFPGSTNGTRWLFARGLIAVVVLMLGYGAYTLFGGHASTPSDTEEDTQSTGGTVAGYAPGTSAITSSSGSTNALPHPGAPNSAPPSPQVAVQPPPLPHYRDLSDSLRAARARREVNDVSGAQAAVNAAFAMQANSADAQMIQHELTPLEQRRDAAIQTAQVCIKDNLWNCVEHSASDALAVDTGSVEAKALLERAIVQTGWAPIHNKAAPVARAAPAAQAAGTTPPLPQLPPLPPAAPAAQATQGATATPPATVAPAPNSVEAQERAIAQFGWKNSAAPGTPPASGAAAAH